MKFTFLKVCSSDHSAKLVNKYAVESKLQFLILDANEQAKYIALCSQPADWRRCMVSHLIPVRRYNKEPRLGMHGDEAALANREDRTSQGFSLIMNL